MVEEIWSETGFNEFSREVTELPTAGLTIANLKNKNILQEGMKCLEIK